MDIIQQLYARSPQWLKSIGVSLYAIRNNRINYGDENRAFLEHIERYAKAELDVIYQYQLAELKRLLQICRQIPYYNGKLPALDTDDLAELLRSIPVLEKADLRQRPTAFLPGPGGKRHLTLHTSGTSGTPLDIACSREARAKNYAFYRAMLRRHQCDYRDRSVTFAGRKIVPADATAAPYWVTDYVTKTLYCSSYHISNASVSDYAAAISKWAPRFIDSYPSAIYDLASLIDELNIRHDIRPRAIFTSSETLLDYQRETIERAFSCPVVDYYGCTEMAVYAAQNAASGFQYHSEPLFGIVEVINGDGHAAREGEEGEIVCTGFINDYMPLLRYRIGDRVLVGETRSVGNFRYYAIQRIVGREDDTIVTPEGRRVGRLDPAFKGVNGIKAAQIHQTGIERLVIRIEKLEQGENIDTDALVRNVQARTSPRMRIDVEVVDRIPRSESGKFKAVVSDLSRKKQ